VVLEEVADLSGLLEEVYGTDYVNYAFHTALKAKKPLLKFLRLLARKKKLDPFMLNVAVMYFEYRTKGRTTTYVFE
jgi:hypothetical protein